MEEEGFSTINKKERTKENKIDAVQFYAMS